MSLYNGPPRPGARGGRGEFSWDNVKNDKDREYYLGHSVKALTGRWQKNKDVYWYTRDPNQQKNMQDEIQAVKAREEQVMMEALGLRPKAQVVEHRQMDEKELADALKRSAAHEEPEDEKDKEKEAVDRVKGLGFVAGAQPAAAVMQKGYVVERMEGTGIPADGGQQGGGGPSGGLPPPPQLPPPPGMGAARSAGGPGGGSSKDALLAMVAQGLVLSKSQIKELTQQDKKAGKKAKKAAKKAKKEAKKRQKEEKRARKQGVQGKRKRSRSADSSSSSSDTSSSGSDSEGDKARGENTRREGRHGHEPPHGPPPHSRHGLEPHSMGYQLRGQHDRGHLRDTWREEEQLHRDRYRDEGRGRPPGGYDRDRGRDREEGGRYSRDDRQHGERGYDQERRDDRDRRDREDARGRQAREAGRSRSRSRSRSRGCDGGGGRRQRHDTP